MSIDKALIQGDLRHCARVILDVLNDYPTHWVSEIELLRHNEYLYNEVSVYDLWRSMLQLLFRELIIHKNEEVLTPKGIKKVDYYKITQRGRNNFWRWLLLSKPIWRLKSVVHLLNCVINAFK